MSIFSRNQATAIPLALPDPNPPQAAAPQGMSLEQFAAVLLAFWKQIAALTLGAIVIGALTIKFLPHTYTATATLIVTSEVRDPLAGRDFPAEMITSYVSTQIELMTSAIVLQPVVKEVNLMQDRNFTAGFSGSGAALNEFVQRNLAAAIAVERGTGGQLLYVNASARTADQAAQIANAVSDVYIDQDRRRLNSPAAERAQRYGEELAELREKAAIAQDKVTAFRNQHSVGQTNIEYTGTEGQALEVLHQKLLDTQNLRRTLEARHAGEQSLADETIASGAVQVAKARLSTQLAELAQARNTYGPQHPKIVELNEQIALTRQAIANESQTLTANTDTEIARARDLERKYEAAIRDQEAKVARFREDQDEGSKLVLELESAKTVYKHALDGFDQIMFQKVANHSNVSVVSRAVPPLQPSKPNKMKLMAMALAGALALGVGLPVAYGLTIARRLRCRDDLERDFGIPVLAQLQSVPALVPAT